MPAATPAKIYGQAKTWKRIKGTEETEANGRVQITIAIGEYKDKDGKTVYLKEKIYEDVLNNIFLNPDAYKITYNQRRKPQMFITYSDNIVCHNSAMFGLVKDLKDDLGTLVEDLLCDSLAEANSYLYETKHLQLDLLRAQVSSDMKYAVPMSFLVAVLRDYFADLMADSESTIGAVLSSMDYAQILDLTEETNRYRMTRAFAKPDTQDLIDALGTTVEEITKALKDELYARVLTKRLKG